MIIFIEMMIPSILSIWTSIVEVKITKKYKKIDKSPANKAGKPKGLIGNFGYVS